MNEEVNRDKTGEADGLVSLSSIPTASVCFNTKYVVKYGIYEAGCHLNRVLEMSLTAIKVVKFKLDLK